MPKARAVRTMLPWDPTSRVSVADGFIERHGFDFAARRQTIRPNSPRAIIVHSLDGLKKKKESACQ